MDVQYIRVANCYHLQIFRNLFQIFTIFTSRMASSRVNTWLQCTFILFLLTSPAASIGLAYGACMTACLAACQGAVAAGAGAMTAGLGAIPAVIGASPTCVATCAASCSWALILP